MTTTTEERVESIIARINAEYGEGKSNKASEESLAGRIPTGSLEFDYATGGGIPIGRWSRFYGQKSSGKSIKCLNIIAEAQKMGMIVAYYNAEKQFTDIFAEKQGVDLNNLIINQGTIIEDIGEILEGTMQDVDLHVIDSCSNCVSRTELADGLNEREYMAIRPRKWAQQFAFAHERLDTSRNTIILVDQIRTKIGGGPHTVLEPPGGKMMEHISSMTVQFKPGGWLFYDKSELLSDDIKSNKSGLSGTSEADGIEIQAQVVKSRVCRPFRTARMKLDLNTLEFDHTDEYLKAAKFFDIVKSSGGWIQIDGEEKSIRPREFRAILEQDEDMKQKIRDKMMESK